MIPNMKFFVVSIVAIFTALGLGIYIGFSMDTEGFITDQQENLVSIVETQFESIIKENKKLTEENEEVLIKNKEGKKYIEESYDLLVPGRLEGLNIALIESNEDYVSSSVGYDIEEAGGNLLSLTSIVKLDKDEASKLAEAIVKGDNKDYINELISSGKISALGNYSQGVDCIIIGAGSKTTEDSSVTVIDKSLIDVAKSNGKKVIAIEKTYVANSHTSKLKEYGLTTVDNINTKMGKIATVLAFDSKLGNYGIKGNAESILPVK